MCLFPVRAELQDFGRPKLDPEGSIQLPCGKCYECISKRACDWALRARHEMSEHNENCFLTLTYDEENLPSYLIVKTEFQKFIKKLRKKLKFKIRYMVSHEYGGQSGRPHHHCIIFGYSPSNQKFLMDAPSGNPLYTSEEINHLWGKGYHSIGDANEKTAYYIASYSLKSSKHNITNPTTGEIVQVTDTMDSSKRPAIGANYFNKHYQQLLDTQTPLPRYYVKLLERNHPELYEQYQNTTSLPHPPKTAQSKLAKYIITEQKQIDSSSKFRHNNTKTLYHEILKTDRNNYVAYNKGKTL